MPTLSSMCASSLEASSQRRDEIAVTGSAGSVHGHLILQLFAYVLTTEHMRKRAKQIHT